MAVIMLCSATGAPGTTTTALGLALQWPRPVLLADCDRDAPMALSTGFLGGRHGVGGMMGLLHSVRRQGSIREQVLEHAEQLDATDRVRILTGFTQPGAAGIFTGWAALAEEFHHLPDRDVIIDMGRCGPEGPPLDLVRSTDRLLMTTRSSLRSLAGLGVHLPQMKERVESTSASCSVGLALVGSGRPYSAAEISSQFSIPVDVQVEWAPLDAAVLSDAGPRPRRFDRGGFVSSLARSAQRLHDAVHDRLDERDDVVGDGRWSA